MGIILPLVVFGKADPDNEFFGGLLGSLIVTLIWSTYLSKSKRVKLTYGDSLLQNDTRGFQKKNFSMETTATPAKDKEMDVDNSFDEYDEDSLYEQALKELDSNNVNKAIWAKAFADAGGNDSKTKANYINYRVENLKLNTASKSHILL